MIQSSCGAHAAVRGADIADVADAVGVAVVTGARSLLRIFSRTILEVNSDPCCKDTAPTIAKIDVVSTISIPEALSLSGYCAVEG